MLMPIQKPPQNSQPAAVTFETSNYFISLQKLILKSMFIKYYFINYNF